MTDLVNWYDGEEHSGKFTPIDFRPYSTIVTFVFTLFEDGNGRVAKDDGQLSSSTAIL